MTHVAVVFAHKEDADPYRQASYDLVVPWFSQFGWEIIVSRGGGGKAAAVNAGVRETQAEVIVQADPDSLLEPDRLRTAVDFAAAGDGLVVPHDRYMYLTQAATGQVLAGRMHWQHARAADCEFSGVMGVGNVVVFNRRTWQTVGGFDERVRTGDDAAFAYACWAWFGDTRRLTGDVVHLWHPRPKSSIPGTPEYETDFKDLAAYRDAAAQGPAAVRTLVMTR